MGYNISIREVPRIKPEMVASCWNAWGCAPAAVKEWLDRWLSLPDELGDIEITGEDFRHLDFAALAQFLAPFAVDNGELLFEGEDGEKWGYWFEGGVAFVVRFEQTNTHDRAFD